LAFNNNVFSSISLSFQQHYNWSRQHEEAKAKRQQFERPDSTSKGMEREPMPEILGEGKESCDSVRKSFGARQTAGCFLVWWLYCSIAIRTINDKLPEFSHRSQFYGDWPLRLRRIQDGYQLIPITGRTGLLRFRCCIKATKLKQSMQLPAENPSHHLRVSPNIVGSGIDVVLSTFPLQNLRCISLKYKYIYKIKRTVMKPYIEWAMSITVAKPTTLNQNEREIFLNLLGKDSLNSSTAIFARHFLIYVTGSDSPSLRWPALSMEYRRACTQVPSQQQPPRYLHDDFTFSKVNMVMKHHRAGRDCSSQLDNLSKNLTTCERGSAQPRSVKCKISATTGHLLLRTQH